MQVIRTATRTLDNAARFLAVGTVFQRFVTTVLTPLEKTAHSPKTAARRFDTEVGFTCPFKLGTMCHLTNNVPPPETRVLQEAMLCPLSLRHRSGISVPLSCGAKYIG